MAKTMFFRNTHTDKEYLVLKFDKAAGTLKLRGPNGVEFDEPYDEQRFKDAGYVLESREVK